MRVLSDSNVKKEWLDEDIILLKKIATVIEVLNSARCTQERIIVTGTSNLIRHLELPKFIIPEINEVDIRYNSQFSLKSSLVVCLGLGNEVYFEFDPENIFRYDLFDLNFWLDTNLLISNNSLDKSYEDNNHWGSEANVFLFDSVSGGTGSGMIIDIPQIASREIDDDRIKKPFVRKLNEKSKMIDSFSSNCRRKSSVEYFEKCSAALHKIFVRRMLLEIEYLRYSEDTCCKTKHFYNENPVSFLMYGVMKNQYKKRFDKTKLKNLFIWKEKLRDRNGIMTAQKKEFKDLFNFVLTFSTKIKLFKPFSLEMLFILTMIKSIGDRSENNAVCVLKLFIIFYILQKLKKSRILYLGVGWSSSLLKGGKQ